MGKIFSYIRLLHFPPPFVSPLEVDPTNQPVHGFVDFIYPNQHKLRGLRMLPDLHGQYHPVIACTCPHYGRSNL